MGNGLVITNHSGFPCLGRIQPEGAKESSKGVRAVVQISMLDLQAGLNI